MKNYVTSAKYRLRGRLPFMIAVIFTVIITVIVSNIPAPE